MSSNTLTASNILPVSTFPISIDHASKILTVPVENIPPVLMTRGWNS